MTPIFVSLPTWATDQWVKIFLILVKISLSYRNYSESPRGMILRRVNLPRVSYPSESISPGYHTPASHVTFWILIKGTVQRGFLPFFHNLSLPGPLSNGLTYFRFWWPRQVQMMKKKLDVENLLIWNDLIILVAYIT